MRQSGVTPIVGARTPDQLNDALATLDAPLDEAAMTALDSVAIPELGFPHDLIASSYLRKLALGDPAQFIMPTRRRA